MMLSTVEGVDAPNTFRLPSKRLVCHFRDPSQRLRRGASAARALHLVAPITSEHRQALYSPLDSLAAAFTGSDTHDFIHGHDENLAIPDTTCPGSSDDRICHLRGLVVVDQDFDLDLG